MSEFLFFFEIGICLNVLKVDTKRHANSAKLFILMCVLIFQLEYLTEEGFFFSCFA